MKKEETINTARRRLGLDSSDNTFILLEGIWNAAIEAAAESAETSNALGHEYEVDIDSILSLKFDKDENNTND